MRMTIDIDSALLADALRRAGLKSKSELITLALRERNETGTAILFIYLSLASVVIGSAYSVYLTVAEIWSVPAGTSIRPMDLAWEQFEVAMITIAVSVFTSLIAVVFTLTHDQFNPAH